MNKYVSGTDDDVSVAHCPSCRGVILKNFKAIAQNGGFSFIIRCPHCEADTLVEWHREAGLSIETVYPHKE